MPKWLLIVDVVLAFLLVALLVVILLFIPSPTPDQRDIERILIAVLFGALGATLTGTAMLKFTVGGQGSKVAISATAGMALLLIAYLVPPYWNPPTPSKGDCVENPVQRGC
jgi:hypothetical protein